MESKVGYASNSRTRATYIVQITFILLTIAVVLLRTYTRARLIRGYGWDDGLIIVAAVWAIGLSSCVLLALTHGLGHNIQDVQGADVIAILKIAIVCAITSATSILATRFSILLFYIRLCPSGNFRRGVYFSMFVTIALYVISIFIVLLECVPLKDAWDINNTVDGHCIDLVKFYWWMTGLNLAMDLLVYVLPIPALWRMNMPRSKRLEICIVMGLGSLIVVASAIRIYEMRGLGKGNVTSSLTGSLNWIAIEMNLGITCASIPSLKPLISRIVPYLIDLPRILFHSFNQSPPSLASNQHNPTSSIIANQGAFYETKLFSRPVRRLRGDELELELYREDEENLVSFQEMIGLVRCPDNKTTRSAVNTVVEMHSEESILSV